jgi:alkanesulfonate monooxygenase SsuD/methylene tetrahydromethanopterin reductase-like flavin-dependent oxidoreductase (luciferase family)
MRCRETLFAGRVVCTKIGLQGGTPDPGANLLDAKSNLTLTVRPHVIDERSSRPGSSSRIVGRAVRCPAKEAPIVRDHRRCNRPKGCAVMKHIGFLSFGHWSSSPHSRTHSASDALLQAIDLAVAAEELGADGAYYRVHHFASQLSSPFPLLAAVGARTSRIEIGTAVIDMRYENPLYMAEDAGSADLISGGRLQLGISRGSPEQVIEGYRYFGYEPTEGTHHADMAREHSRVFLEVLAGEGFAEPNPRPMFENPPGLLRVEPHSSGLRERIWWGAGTRKTAEWAAEQGMNLMSSTLLSEDTGVPFHQLQAEQIHMFRTAWTNAGHPREPRVSVSRSIFPIVSDLDRSYFGREVESQDQIGYLDGGIARFGKTYAAPPELLIEQLADDEAIASADTLLLAIPNQLGVDYCAHVLESVLTDVAPALGWR